MFDFNDLGIECHSWHVIREGQDSKVCSLQIWPPRVQHVETAESKEAELKFHSSKCD